MSWKDGIRKDTSQLIKVTVEGLTDKKILYENSVLTIESAKSLIASIDRQISEESINAAWRHRDRGGERSTQPAIHQANTGNSDYYDEDGP